MATTGGNSTQAKPASPATKAKPAAPSRTRIVDIYPSARSCNFAGRLGERNGDWDDYVCYRTGRGYALRISFDSWGDWNSWDNDNWRGPWGFRGHGDNFWGPGGGHWGNGGGHWGNGGPRGHGPRGHGPRGNNGVGAIPGLPSNIPPIGTHSPS